MFGKTNLNLFGNVDILCLLLLLPLPINSHDVKHPLLSLVEQNNSEGVRVGNRVLGECSKLLTLANGRVNMTEGEGGRRILHFSCFTGYRLLGPPKLLCPPDEWQRTAPFCERTGCPKLPMIMNGGERITGAAPTSSLNSAEGGGGGGGEGEGEELYPEGVVVEYECKAGFRLVPITSQHRVCREGKWTGSAVACVFEGCPRIDHPDNGYVEEPGVDQEDASLGGVVMAAASELEGAGGEGEDYGHVRVGARVLFKCNEGFALIGPLMASCQPNGRWQPHTLPVCTPDYRHNTGKCLSPSPLIEVLTERGEKTNWAAEGAVVQLSCLPGYRDKAALGQGLGCPTEGQAPVRCKRGEWQGRIPNCVRAHDCLFPPKISHGRIEKVDGGVGGGHFGIGGQVTYTCLAGYQLRVGGRRRAGGEATLTCVRGGCWEPNTLPRCVLPSSADLEEGELYLDTSSSTSADREEGELYLDTSSSSSFQPGSSTNLWMDLSPSPMQLFSIGIAISIVFFVLPLFVALVWRHRAHTHTHMRSHAQLMHQQHHRHHHHQHRGAGMSHGGGGSPPLMPPLPHDPDRVALIAFADGIQSGLPSYEEACRIGGGSAGQNNNSNRGGGGLLGGGYRGLHPPPPPSWASSLLRRAGGGVGGGGGESMGSTDTMTATSDSTSTTVTLDTVSCHTCSSTSQTASCRAICGSLASFDTSSVVNTEGVPLLEENEMEDGGMAMLGGIEGSTPPACDNTSFKLQSDIDSIHS